MKTKLNRFFWGLVFSVLLTACNKGNDDVPNLDNPVTVEPTEEVIAKGTVSLKTLIKEAIDVKTAKPPTLGEVIDNVYLNIYNSDGIAAGGLYNGLPEFITLNVGRYDFVLFKPDAPLYGADGFFEVLEGANTEVNTELSLLDVAVTFNFSEEIQLNYPDIRAGAAIFNYSDAYVPENSDYSWDLSENGNTKYFRMDEYSADLEDFSRIVRTAELVIGIITVDPSTGNEILIATKTYGAVANQHYNITVEYSSSADDGTVNFNIVLGDENVIEDTITYPLN